MPSVRMNITLPSEVANDLNAMVSERKRSAFIAESLRYYIEQLRKKELETDLAEGYKATKEEGQSIASEFEASDLEGWDDY